MKNAEKILRNYDIQSSVNRRMIKSIGINLQKYKGDYALLVGHNFCSQADLLSREDVIQFLKSRLYEELLNETPEILSSSENQIDLFSQLGWFQTPETEYAELLNRAFTSDYERRQYLLDTFQGDPSKSHLLLANIIKNGFIKDIFQLSPDKLIQEALTLLLCTDYRQIQYDMLEDCQKFIGKSINIWTLHDYFIAASFENFPNISSSISDTLYTIFKQEFSEKGIIIIGFDAMETGVMRALIKACQEFHFSKGIDWLIEKSEFDILSKSRYFCELQQLHSANLNLIIVDSYESAINLIHETLSLKLEELRWDENWSGIVHHRKFLLEKIFDYQTSHNISAIKVPVRIDEFQSAEMGTKKQYDLYTAVSRYGLILILGDAGTGKTTLLDDLCVDYLQKDNEKIPLLVHLRDYHTDLIDLIRSSFLGEIDLNTLKAGLRRGKFLILLDGLNETGENFERVIRDINQFTSKMGFPRNQYIVTSRGYRCEGDILGFKAFVIAPLSGNLIGNFLLSELGQESQISISKLMETSIYNICSNVMILTLLAQSYKKTGCFPSNQATLYNDFITELIGRSTSKFDLRTKRLILMDVAYQMGQLVVIGYPQIKKSIAEFFSKGNDAMGLEEAVNVLNELRQDGILSIKDELTVEFFHQSVQDYLRADVLANVWNSSEKSNVLITARDARNYEVMIFLSGIINNSDLLIESLIEINIYLAVRCVGSAKQVSSMVVDKVIDNLVQLFNGEYSSRSVFEALAYLGERSVVPSAKFLKDNRAEFRHFVDYLIKLLEPSKALESLHRMIRNQNDEHIRLHLAEALGQIQSAEDIPRMYDLFSFSNEQETIVRALILNSLLLTRKKIGQPAFAAKLIDQNSRTYFETGDADRELDNLTNRLMDIVRTSDKYYFRAHACATLGEIGDRKAVTTLANALLHDEKWNVRFRSAKGLGTIGDKRAIFPLLEAFKSDEDNWVRGHSIDALGKIGDETIILEIKKALEDKSEFVRAMANDAIHQIKLRATTSQNC